MNYIRRYRKGFTALTVATPLLGLNLDNQDIIILTLVSLVLFYIAFKIKSIIVRRILIPGAMLLILITILRYFGIL